MARYQIRTPDEVSLEDVIDRLTDTSWQILRKWSFFAGDVTQADYMKLRDVIEKTLANHVRTYRLCGLSNICAENLRGTEWASSSHVMDANPWDKIYHLFPRTLDGFRDALTQAAVAVLRPLLKPEVEDEAESTLQIVFQTILGEYLYQDPLCGKTELCVYSSSAPTSIWETEEEKSAVRRSR